MINTCGQRATWRKTIDVGFYDPTNGGDFEKDIYWQQGTELTHPIPLVGAIESCTPTTLATIVPGTKLIGLFMRIMMQQICGMMLLTKLTNQPTATLNYAFNQQHQLIKAEVQVENGCGGSSPFKGWVLIDNSTICQNDLLVNLQTTQPTCTNPKGSIAASVAGSGTYYYQWDNDVQSITSSINQLNPGVYRVTVTDENGRQGEAKAEIMPFQVLRSKHLLKMQVVI
jgi:hypothetical protein